MVERNHIEKLNQLNSAQIGFEFEFFTGMLKGAMKKSLSEATGKSIVVCDKYHSKFTPTAKTFKLEHDYSGGSKMYELVTGPMPYHEAIPVMYRVLRWIDQNGYTTDRSAFQFSISFDRFDREIKNRIETLDKLKFLLGLDEGKIYSSFGNRSNNVYAKSIKRVVPRNRFSILENITSIDPKMFKIPEEKYYGVNFSKLPKGYIEIRYLGGKDYTKKIKEIREVVDYVTLYLRDHLSGRISGYNKDDLKKLQSMMDEYKKVVRSFSDPDSFFMYYPDFHLLVDLKGWDENIKSYYPVIRDKIFDLIVDGNMRSGFLNYDTSIGRFQVKDAKIRDAFSISGFDLIDCTIKNSIVKDCNIYGCKVSGSEIIGSQLMGSNDVKNSKIKDTSASYGDKLSGCFIDSPKKRLDCDIEGGVLRAGNTTETAKISKTTETVKGWSEERSSRFITDSRLKDLNSKFPYIKFKDQN